MNIGSFGPLQKCPERADKITVAAAERHDIEHLLRRTGFTATTDAVDALDGLSWEEAVEAVLDLTDAPDPDDGVPTVDRPPAPIRDWSNDYRNMVHYWLDRCATTPTPIVEKMTLFWHGVLTSSAGGVPLGAILDQHQLYRRKGLGGVHELVTDVAIDPAMLVYLDGRSSHRWSPNENFPRELLELFCLGVGNYTEADVRAASQAFTGYRIDDEDKSYYFDAHWHDDTNKTFMGVTKNWDGPAIIDHILNGPVRPVAARHIARRLWSFLAYPDPSDDVISTIATAFASADLQMIPLLRAILLHPEFRSERARNGLARSPIELAVAAMMHTGLTSREMRPDWSLAEMGQRPFRPPNVDGWTTNEGWFSTATVWGRKQFADQVARVGNDVGMFEGLDALDPDAAAVAALDAFGVTAPTQTTRTTIASSVSQIRTSARWAEPRVLISLAVLSPEFALA